MNPIHIPVGTKVKITKKTIETMVNGNKSIKGFPSRDFIAHIKCYLGKVGKVERQFLPGYAFNLEFPDGQIFHCQDNWVQVVA